MEFQGKCYSCGSEFRVIDDDNKIPHFTKARKNDWISLKCTKCGFDNKYARFSMNSNLLLILPVN